MKLKPLGDRLIVKAVEEDDIVTVVRFSAILERPEQISERLSPGAPTQN